MESTRHPAPERPDGFHPGYFPPSGYHLANLYEKLGDLRNDFRNHNLVNLIVSKVEGNRVLDIGCGNGYLLGILAQEGRETFGIEPNKRLVDLAKSVNPKLNVLEGIAEDVDTLLDKKMDSIIMVDVLEHMEDDETQVRRIHNRLNVMGQLVLVVPAYQFFYGKRDIRMGHYRRYSKKRLVHLLSRNGYRISTIRYWNMLGVVPYLFYEKVLRRELNTELRRGGEKGTLRKLLRRLLHLWFKYVENNFNPGFGLSLVCVAEKE